MVQKTPKNKKGDDKDVKMNGKTKITSEETEKKTMMKGNKLKSVNDQEISAVHHSEGDPTKNR